MTDDAIAVLARGGHDTGLSHVSVGLGRGEGSDGIPLVDPTDSLDERFGVVDGHRRDVMHLPGAAERARGPSARVIYPILTQARHL